MSSVYFSSYCKRIFDQSNGFSMTPALAMMKMSMKKKVGLCERVIWGSAASLTAIVSLPIMCLETLAKIVLGSIAKLFCCSEKAKTFSGFCFKHIDMQLVWIPRVLFLVALPIGAIEGNFCRKVI